MRKQFVLLYILISFYSIADAQDTIRTLNGKLYIGTIIKQDNKNYCIKTKEFNVDILKENILYFSCVDTTKNIRLVYSKDTISEFVKKTITDVKTAGDYLIQSANQKYTSYGFAGGAIGFSLFGAIAFKPEFEQDRVLSEVSIHKAGIKLNQNTTFGLTSNGVGAIINF